jgi:hypothetical protein
MQAPGGPRVTDPGDCRSGAEHASQRCRLGAAEAVHEYDEWRSRNSTDEDNGRPVKPLDSEMHIQEIGGRWSLEGIERSHPPRRHEPKNEEAK